MTILANSQGHFSYHDGQLGGQGLTTLFVAGVPAQCIMLTFAIADASTLMRII